MLNPHTRHAPGPPSRTTRLAVLRQSLLIKLIVFVLIPVVSGAALTLALALGELQAQSRDDATRWMHDQAGALAASLGMPLGAIANLAQTLAHDSRLASGSSHPIDLLQQFLREQPLVESVELHWPASGGLRLDRGAIQAQVLSPAQTSPVPRSGRWLAPAAAARGIAYHHPLSGTQQAAGQILVRLSQRQLLGMLKALTVPVSVKSTAYLLDSGYQPLLESQAHTLPTLRQPGRRTAQARGTGSYVAPIEVPYWGDSNDRHWLSLRQIPGTPFVLGLAVAEKALLNPGRQRKHSMTLTLLMVLLLLLLAIAFALAQALQPLRVLTSSAEQIARGELKTALPPAAGDEVGRLSHAVKSLLELLQRREREAEAGREEMQSRMQARTRELDQLLQRYREQQVLLQQAHDQAESANRAKSDFLSHMTHELRTPLNAVLGYTQILLRDAGVTTRQREQLQAIENSGQHLLILINDVLDLSRLEAGGMQIELHSLDLHQLLREVVTMLAEQAAAKQLELRLEPAEGLPVLIRSDATKLRQILLNLLGNAVKFTTRGSIRLRASVTHPAGDAASTSDPVAPSWLEFEVEDTGAGIPEAQLNGIFNAFRQGQAGLEAGGTGLGLAISQRLVDLLGGPPIRVQSRLGEGSRFGFSLPLLKPDEGDEPGQSLPRLSYTAAPGSRTETAPLELSAALIAQICEHLEQALELGDMAPLLALAEDSRQLPPALARQIAGLARRFDFPGLRGLCDRLQNPG